MNSKDEIIKNRYGFIAALDQSGGSSAKTLANYGILEDSYHNDEEMFALIHKMRSRIISSPVFDSDRIIGVILFEDTMNKQVAGKPTADYLWEEKNIVSFLKIDKGLKEVENGVQLLKDIPSLVPTLQNAVNKNIYGTKMRSVIKELNEEGIREVVRQQFELAHLIGSCGLVPIIEPEVDINAYNKRGCEELLLKYIKDEMDKFAPNIKVIFKFTLPERPNFYDSLLSYNNVLKIVALSGGYSRFIANKKLKENEHMVASFSRALLEGLNVNQTPSEFNTALDKTLEEIYDASINKM